MIGERIHECSMAICANAALIRQHRFTAVTPSRYVLFLFFVGLALCTSLVTCAHQCVQVDMHSTLMPLRREAVHGPRFSSIGSSISVCLLFICPYVCLCVCVCACVCVCICVCVYLRLNRKSGQNELREESRDSVSSLRFAFVVDLLLLSYQTQYLRELLLS